MGFFCGSQPLKSPTRETDFASGAGQRKLTARSVFSFVMVILLRTMGRRQSCLKSLKASVFRIREKGRRAGVPTGLPRVKGKPFPLLFGITIVWGW